MKLFIFNTRKNAIAFVILIVVSFLISSCEKVININLNAKAPQIIIEGIITDQPEPYTVSLTQTVNFDESNNFPPVSGATVIISDNSGYSEILTETTPGIYTTSAIQGTAGKIYTLKVTANGKEYTGVATMPPPVNIDTLTITSVNTPKGSNKTIYVNFTDPTGINNYYRFIKIINGTAQSSIFITDDLLKDGNIINQPLLSRGQDEVKIKSGDMVSVVCQTIDKNVYNYFRSLLQLSTGGMINQSSSPANPLSNFNNGALGYFNACAVTSKTIVIP
ncbi:MAG TPA: DUF4249 domain-containing protein [Bacteroidales bacterium]|nr:DUF4249 domain-containing protein [Bacteroidales bacterium]